MEILKHPGPITAWVKNDSGQKDLQTSEGFLVYGTNMSPVKTQIR